MSVIKLKAANGKWRRFSFKIDSGADMTLMRKEDCKTLGLVFEDGIEETFHAANRGKMELRIHPVDMKIGNHVINEVPIAFANNPIGNLLLGRLLVFEPFDITFQGLSKQTTFAFAK